MKFSYKYNVCDLGTKWTKCIQQKGQKNYRASSEKCFPLRSKEGNQTGYADQKDIYLMIFFFYRNLFKYLLYKSN